MESVYARKRPYTFRISPYLSVYDRILTVYMAQYYGTVYGRRFYSVFVRIRSYFSVFRRIRSRRYTIVILSHVKHRISPFTVVYERASLTWVHTCR